MRLVIALLSLSIGILGISAQGLTPPSLKKPARANDLYFFSGDDVDLECQATGNGEISYQWYVNEKLVQGDSSISFDSKTGKLSIKGYDDKYDGNYVCIATLDGAAAMSEVQRVREKKLDRFKTRDEVITLSGTEYNYMFLNCSDKGKMIGPPNEFIYNWYFTTKSEQVSLDEGRLFIDVDGSLHFSYLKYSDQPEGNKKYLCGYSMTNLKSIHMGNNIFLNIEQKSPQDVKPVFRYSNTGVKGLLGGTANLECFFSGYDMNSADHLPDTKWFNDDDEEIKNGDKYELSNKNRILKIKNIQASDEKPYLCQGTTTSLSSAKVKVMLDVISPPIWDEAPVSDTKAEGESATFNCKTSALVGEPAPDAPEWYINGKKFDGSFDFTHFVLSSDKKTMVIKKLQKPQDIMCVQCIVKNDIGSVMGEACLNVLEPIVIGTFPKEIQEIEKGDIIDLTVQATTDPYISALQYIWTVKNKTYISPTFPPFAEKNPKTDQLFINTSVLSRDDYDTLGGLYKCTVKHTYSSKFVTTDVRLKDVTPAPVTASASIDMWIVGLIIGIIFLIIVVAIIIFVICRKQQEGDYNVDKKETGAGLDPEKELRDKGFNDLSRPDYEDYEYPEKKPRGDLEYDDVPIGGDDESLGEYGDEEDTHFNEDGSFIGIYQKRENERQNHKTESTI